MSEAFIYDAVRSPRGRGEEAGALYRVRPLELLTQLLGALQERNGFEAADVDDVKIGCVTQSGDQGACIARLAALQAWDGQHGPGVTLNRYGGSGLEAVNQAAASVKAGFADLVVAGGVESMSRVRPGSDGGALFDPDFQWRVGSVPPGISADLIATLRGYDREQVDAYAVESQRRTARAMELQAFALSLVPITDVNGLSLLEVDEHPQPGTTLASLAKLEASYETLGTQFGLDALVRSAYPQIDRVDHVHHAGNVSGVVDGAAAVLIGSAEMEERLDRPPRAKIRSVGVATSEPIAMLLGPMPATKRALTRAGMELGDIDLIEVNEAFAAVPLAFMEDLDVHHDRVNVNGGAIAMGHPLGATGAILLGTLLDELEARDLTTGLATLSIGGGMGIATIIERV